MRIKVKLFFGVLLLILLSLSSKSFGASFSILREDSSELLIAVAKINPEKLEQLKTELQAETSFKYLTYCSNHSVFLINTQLTLTETNIILNRINKLFGEPLLSIKQIGFGDIVSFCEIDALTKRNLIKKQK